MDASRPSADPTDADLLAHGREILRAEGEAILGSADALGDAFARAVRVIAGCTGSVVVTGIGKAGLVARKISATLASTGSPSHFLHPAEALHGDLGALRSDDVVLALSQSGESEEVTRLLPHVAARRIQIVALTGSTQSTLGRAADVVVPTGSVREACTLGLAPSTSTSLMLALGDAIALVTSRLRQFTREDFAARHPDGSLGRQLMRVEDVMAGIFTDSDLARLFERRNDTALDHPIGSVMTARPTTVPFGTRLSDALAILEARRLSELPVVDEAGRVAGLLDIVDLVGLVPPEMLESPLVAASPRASAA